MELERELRSLAEAEDWGGPVLSVYLDARWRDEAQRERMRVFWENARGRARRDGIPEAVLIPVDHYLEALIRQGGGSRAVALFSSRDKFRVIALPAAVGQFAAWGPRPSLLPMVRAVSESERALVAVVGAKISRLYETVGTQIRSRIELDRFDFPGRHDRGGLAQRRFASHLREHIRWELEPVARALVEAWDRNPCTVLVCGTPQVNPMFVDLLPQRVKARTISTENLSGDPRFEAEEIRERVSRYLDHERVSEMLRLEDKIWQESQGGGAGVLGAEDVLLALQEGRVHELLMREGLQVYGAECTRCGALDVKRVTGCPYCGATVRAGDLSEAIVRRAIQAGARIRFMLDEPRRRQMDGIAALLRPTRGAGWLSLGRQSRGEDVAVSRPS